MTDDKFGQKVGDTLLDPRNNRIWKGLLWLLAILLLVDVALGWYWSWEPDLSEVNRRDGAVAGETMTCRTALSVCAHEAVRASGENSSMSAPQMTKDSKLLTFAA